MLVGVVVVVEQSRLRAPMDPDVDLRLPAHQRELRPSPWAVIGAISLGGGLGGLARYGLGEWLPAGPGQFPWATFAVNVSGCALIGVLMVLVTEVWPEQRLLRPFLGVGLLGGYTTFSFVMMEAQHLLESGAGVVALGYLAGTALTAVLAVVAGAAPTRWVVRRRERSRVLAAQEASS